MATVFERIQAFNKDRVPQLVAKKYALMSADAFRFFRGTCHLFYEDLAQGIDWKDPTKAWICGDLHLENFGSYKGDNRVVYFDINDYDESILGPVTWEVVRLLTSIHIAAQVLSFSPKEADRLPGIFLETYIATLRTGKAVSIEKETAKGIVKDFLKKVAHRSDKELVAARTEKHNKLKIDGVKFLELPEKDKKRLMDLTGKWFSENSASGAVTIHDAAIRIAGTGSVGVKRFVLLKEAMETGERHLIDMKEAKPSALRPYINIQQPAWQNEAARVETIQKRCQYVEPAWLQSMEIDGTAYVIKELQPLEDKINIALCKDRFGDLSKVIGTMGHLAAAAQLRSSGRQGASIADELIAFAGDAQHWEQKLLHYARQYARQVFSDFDSFIKDYPNNRI